MEEMEEKNHKKREELTFGYIELRTLFIFRAFIYLFI
jgi:hypothetical protein